MVGGRADKVLEGIIYPLSGRIPWRDLPELHGSRCVYSRSGERHSRSVETSATITITRRGSVGVYGG